MQGHGLLKPSVYYIPFYAWMYTYALPIILTYYIGVRCPLNKLMYLVYSWATKQSVSSAIADVNVGGHKCVPVVPGYLFMDFSQWTWHKIRWFRSDSSDLWVCIYSSREGTWLYSYCLNCCLTKNLIYTFNCNFCWSGSYANFWNTLWAFFYFLID